MYCKKSRRQTSRRWSKRDLFSRSVMSNSLGPHGLQHTRLPCPSPSPGTCSNSCPLNQSHHPTIKACLLDQLLFIEPIIRSSCKRHFILTKAASGRDYDYPWTISVLRRSPVAFEGLGWLKEDMSFLERLLSSKQMWLLWNLSYYLTFHLIILSSKWGEPGQWPSDAGAKLCPLEGVFFLLSLQYSIHGMCSSFTMVVLFYFYRFHNVL